MVMMVVVKETFLEEGREKVGAWEWDGGRGGVGGGYRTPPNFSSLDFGEI